MFQSTTSWQRLFFKITLQKYFNIQSSLSTPPTVFSWSRAGQDTKSTALKLFLDSVLLLGNHRYSLMVWRTSEKLEKHISIMKQQTFPLVLISHFIFPEVGRKLDYMMNLVYMGARMSQYIHVSLPCHKEMCSDTQWLYFYLKSLSVFPRNQIPTPVHEGVCLSHRWSRMTQLKASRLPQPPVGGPFDFNLGVCSCMHANLRPQLRHCWQFLRQQQAPPICPCPSHFLCISIKYGVVSVMHSLRAGSL